MRSQTPRIMRLVCSIGRCPTDDRISDFFMRRNLKYGVSGYTGFYRILGYATVWATTCFCTLIGYYAWPLGWATVSACCYFGLLFYFLLDFYLVRYYLMMLNMGLICCAYFCFSSSLCFYFYDLSAFSLYFLSLSATIFSFLLFSCYYLAFLS